MIRQLSYLFIINDGPYGTEKAFNALRLALTLQKENKAEITVYLLADGVANAVANQETPEGYYNIGRMLKGLLVKGGKVKL